MPDTLEYRVAKLERNFDEIRAFLDRIEQNFAQTRQIIAQIKRDTARSVAPVARAAPDGTVAIRDPSILVQQQFAQTHGYSKPVTLPRKFGSP